MADEKTLLKIINDIDLFGNEIGIKSGLDTVIDACIKLGCSKHELLSAIGKMKRKVKTDFDSFLNMHKEELPKTYEKTKYLKTQQAQREALSQKAVKCFLSAQNDSATTGFSEAFKRGDLTNEDYAKCIESEKILKALMYRGASEDAYQRNLERLKLFLGKNLDEQKLGHEEFEKQRKQQVAKLVNDRISELLNKDLDRFEGLSDEALVEKWPQYVAAYYPASLIMSELFELEKQGISFDDRLCTLLSDACERYRMQYSRNEEKMCAIMNPYYATINSEGSINCSDADNQKLLEIAEKTGDASLGNYFANAISYLDTQNICTWENVVSIMHDRLDIKSNDGFVFFDANGIEITKPKEVLFKKIKQNGVIFAAPKDQPDFLMCFEINEKGVVSDSKALSLLHAGEMNKIRASMSRSLSQAPTYLGLGRDSFYKGLGIGGSERLTSQQIEARRKISDIAKKAIEDYKADAESIVKTISEKPENIIPAGAFSRFFFKAGEANRAENIKIYNSFYGLDNNGNSLNISKAELNKTRLNLIGNRIAEFKKMGEAFEGKEYSDEDIAVNYAKLKEYSDGMRSALDYVLKSMNELGVEADEKLLSDAKDEQKKASYVGNVLLDRAEYIACPHYMFGAEKQLMSPNAYSGLMPKADRELKKAINWAFEHKAKLVQEIKTVFSDNPKFDVDKLSFAVDQDGHFYKLPANADRKMYDALLEDLAFSLSEGGRITLLGKDGKLSGIVDFNGATKLPPELNEQEITPELVAETRFNIYQKKIADISKKKISPARKELLEDIAGSEYELGSVAEAYYNAVKSNDESQIKMYRESLTNYMSTYLARLTINKKLEGIDSSQDKNIEKELLSKESLKNYEESLKKSDSLSIMVNHLIESGNPMSFLNSEDMFNELNYQQTRVEKEEARTNKNLGVMAANEAYDTMETVVSAQDIYEREMWGLTKDTINEVKKASYIGFSFERGALMSLAISKMLDDDISLFDIFSPKNQKKREQYMRECVEMAKDNNHREMGRLYMTGVEKCNQHVQSLFKWDKTMSYERYKSDEFEAARTIPFIIQDCVQECDRGLYSQDTAQKSFLEKHPGETFPEKIIPNIDTAKYDALVEDSHTYKMMIMNYDSVLEGLSRKLMGGVRISSYEFKTVFMYLVQVKYANMLVNAPENAGKPVIDTLEYRKFVEKAGMLGLMDYPKMARKLSERIDNDNYFAWKFAAAVLDGSLEENLDMSIDFSKPEDEICSIDFDKLMKFIEKKPVDVDLFQEKALRKLNEKNQALAQESFEKAVETITKINNSRVIRQPEAWGLTQEYKDDMQSTEHNPVGFTISRGSAETLSLCMMVNDGISFETIFDTDLKDSQALREEYAKKALALMEGAKAKEVLYQLMSADKKFCEHMESEYDKAGNMTLAKYLSDDFKYIRVIKYFTQDIGQESEKAFYYINKMKDQFVKNHPGEALPEDLKVMDREEFNRSLGTSQAAEIYVEPYSAGIENFLVNASENEPVMYSIRRCAKRLLGTVIATKYAGKLIKAQPNAGKAFHEIVPNAGENFANIYFMLPGEENSSIEKVFKVVDTDEAFAKKLVMSALDGSLEGFIQPEFGRKKNGLAGYRFDEERAINLIAAKPIDEALFEKMPFRDIEQKKKKVDMEAKKEDGFVVR